VAPIAGGEAAVSTAREEILQSIRASLNRTGALEASVQRALDERLNRHEVHVQPAVKEELGARFVARLEAVAGTSTPVAAMTDVAQAIADYLAAQKLASRLVIAPDPLLSELSWPPSLVIEQRPATRDDHVSVTAAFAAVAETGSLVLVSGPSSPTTLNFLPDVHIVVLRRAQIVRHIEEVWARLRAEIDVMPRTINFITGPSRTADIEQTIQLGAHGPRSLHVILVQA
jgi:L-lactate dehydrogenase complex protein LldG